MFYTKIASLLIFLTINYYVVLVTKSFLVGFYIIFVCFRYYFKSGNAEHPSDKFYNTTVEVLPVELPNNSPLITAANVTSDGYIIVGEYFLKLFLERFSWRNTQNYLELSIRCQTT